MLTWTENEKWFDNAGRIMRLKVEWVYCTFVANFLAVVFPQPYHTSPLHLKHTHSYVHTYGGV